jgi:hypothetical protein
MMPAKKIKNPPCCRAVTGRQHPDETGDLVQPGLCQFDCKPQVSLAEHAIEPIVARAVLELGGDRQLVNS